MTRSILFLVVTGLALGACAAKGIYPAEGPDGEPLDRKHSILYLDQSLPNVLTVTGQHAERTPDGRLLVEVTFRNEQPKRIRLQIETQFRTADGRTVETTPYRNFFLGQHATTTFRVTSMNDRSDSFLMQIRRRKP